MATRNSWRSVVAVCPFFRSDQPCAIFCEGIVDRSTIRLSFKRKEDCDLQFGVFCAAAFKNCEIYRAVIAAKYQDD